ncbi:MAG TPA: hypothetical protein VKV15_06490 [Bryobacteraceae bacterium]|nr:hypothetical protein [Bryobacteraceae bacterium]
MGRERFLPFSEHVPRCALMGEPGKIATIIFAAVMALLIIAGRLGFAVSIPQWWEVKLFPKWFERFTMGECKH